MALLAVNTDDKNLKRFADILQVEIERICKLFARLDPNDGNTLDDFRNLLSKSKIEVETSKKELLENLQIRTKLAPNTLKYATYEDIMNISSQLWTNQKQLFNLLKTLEQNSLFEIYGPSDFDIDTKYVREFDKEFKNNPYLNLKMESLTQKDLKKEIDSLCEAFETVTLQQDSLSLNEKSDECLINFSGVAIGNDLSSMNEPPSLANCTESDSNLETNTCSEIKKKIGYCNSTFIKDPTSCNTSTNLVFPNSICENVNPNSINTNHCFEFQRLIERRYDLLIYLIRKLEKYIIRLNVPEKVNKILTRKFDFRLPSERFDESNWLARNQSSLLPRNWSMDDTDSDYGNGDGDGDDDATENENNDFRIRLPKHLLFDDNNQNDRKEFESYANSYLIKQEREDVDDVEDEQKLDEEKTSSSYDLSRSTKIQQTSLPNFQLNDDSDFLKICRKIHTEIQLKSKLTDEMKKISNEAILSDDLPLDPDEFKKLFRNKYAPIERTLCTSLQNMYDTKDEKSVEDCLTKIRNNLIK